MISDRRGVALLEAIMISALSLVKAQLYWASLLAIRRRLT